MITTFRAKADLLILPAAEYNNTTGNSGTVNIQRSMSGKIYSTIKPNNNVTLKLHFLLNRLDLKRLQIFMFNHPAELITIEDWDNRIYVGYIYNETFESTEEQQWNNPIDILFEGKQL